MTKLIDYAPYVAQAVARAGAIKQTDLTEAVWGTSGRGNTTLTNTLFPWMVEAGYLRMNKQGRSKIFSVTSKGLALASTAEDRT